MDKDSKLTFDKFMLEFVNNKKEFRFKLFGLKFYFCYEKSTPKMILDDGSIKREYKFDSAFDICRLSFNGVPFSTLFEKLVAEI